MIYYIIYDILSHMITFMPFGLNSREYDSRLIHHGSRLIYHDVRIRSRAHLSLSLSLFVYGMSALHNCPLTLVGGQLGRGPVGAINAPNSVYAILCV